MLAKIIVVLVLALLIISDIIYIDSNQGRYSLVFDSNDMLGKAQHQFKSFFQQSEQGNGIEQIKAE